MQLDGYMRERQQRQQVCMKLLASTSTEPLSPRAVVIPVISCPQVQLDFLRVLEWMVLSVSPPSYLIAAGGSGEGVTFPLQ